MARSIFRESDVILAQEYLYTEFDWRVGVLNRQPIFVCQYFMRKNHWQIVKHSGNGRFKEGRWRTLDVSQAPEAVVRTAVKAANLIGDGLYGVDLKETPRGVVVLEINDNPNLDAGVEDLVLKDELYRLVLREFVRRIETRGTSNGNGSKAEAPAGQEVLVGA
jgi:glutathione synthase/RimK-type ligase-like ATP-grasp enzyme